MEARVHRPLICPGCRSELSHPDDDCLVVVHCTTCGNTFVEHIPHGPLHREHYGESHR